MKEKYELALITTISVICYCNTLFGDFVFDDSEAILKNKDVMPYTPIGEVFFNDFWGTNIALNLSHKSYRPLTILSYRLNVVLANSKLNALHFHATNISLYTILCLLTFFTFKLFLRISKISTKSDIPLLSTILFTVHPVHAEVVAGLVGRADILCSILFLIVLLIYNRVIVKHSVLLFILVVVLIIAAVLCKETAIMALPFCAVLDLIHQIEAHGKVKKIINSTFVLRIVSLILFGLIIMYYRLAIMDFQGPLFTSSDNPAAYSNNLFSKILTYNYVYLLNLLLLLWPQWLCFDWSMGCIPLIENTCDIRVIFTVLFWIFSLAIIKYVLLGYLKRNKRCHIILGFSLLILPFIPAMNILIKVGFVIAERTLLLPSAGFCFLIIIGLKQFEIKYTLYKKYIYISFCTLCVILFCRTIKRNADWLSEKQLYNSALDVCPLNAKVHYNIAKVAADEQKKMLAVEEYRKAIDLNPNYEQAMNNLANLLREEKKFEEAEVLLRKALEIRPNFAAAWMNLGIVLTNKNLTDQAEYCYLQAISYRKKYPDCYYNLGNLYLDLKRNEDALKSWEKAVYYRPTHTAAWSNTLVLLDSQFRYKDVLALGKIALMHNPKSPALHFSIANTLGKLQEFEKAEKHFLEALNFNPYNPLYFSNLGVLYHRWGNTEKAREMYKKALQLDPNMKSAEGNLRKLLNAQI